MVKAKKISKPAVKTKSKQDKKKKDDFADIKKAYSILQKKYKLPKFDVIDKEFELYKIDPHSPLLTKEIKRAMMMKLQWVAEFVEPVLNPNSGSLHSMIDSKILESEKKEDIYLLFKELMELIHKSVSAGLKGEKYEADLINECWQRYPSIKQRLIQLSDKLIDGWIKEEKAGSAERYVG